MAGVDFEVGTVIDHRFVLDKKIGTGGFGSVWRALDKAGTLSQIVSSEKVLWKDYAFSAHISCGVVEIKKGWTVDDALHTADSAMYAVKKQR